MTIFKGRGITRGKASGEALVTSMPMNFTAAHTKLRNFFNLSEVQDRHHELFRQRIAGKILFLPTCVGSTYTGVVLLELMYRQASPLAIVVQEANPLLVSGAVLADVWFHRGIPVVEYWEPDLNEAICNQDHVDVDADSGEITLH